MDGQALGVLSLPLLGTFDGFDRAIEPLGTATMPPTISCDTWPQINHGLIQAARTPRRQSI